MGRKGDHQYGGTIMLPDGTIIVMIFNKGIWRLPTLTHQKATDLHHHKYVSNLKGSRTRVADTNPYSTLLELAYET
eukprot:3934220-Rhodomonas_salina.2